MAPREVFGPLFDGGWDGVRHRAAPSCRICEGVYGCRLADRIVGKLSFIRVPDHIEYTGDFEQTPVTGERNDKLRG